MFNIFKTIGFEDYESTNLLIRSQLFCSIIDYIKKHEFSLEQSTQALKMTEEQVENLLHGKISLFSIDQLVKMANVLGIDIYINCEDLERI